MWNRTWRPCSICWVLLFHLFSSWSWSPAWPSSSYWKGNISNISHIPNESAPKSLLVVGSINKCVLYISQQFTSLTSSSLSSFLSLLLSPIRSSSGTSWVRLTLLSSGGRSTWGISNLRDKSGHSATCCCSKGAIWERKNKTSQDTAGSTEFIRFGVTLI